MGAGWRNAGSTVPFQLEARFDHSRFISDELLLPNAQRVDQESADCRVPESVGEANWPADPDCVGRPAGAPKPVGERLSGLNEWADKGCISSTLCTGYKPGRIFLGMVEAPCTCELLSGIIG